MEQRGLARPRRNEGHLHEAHTDTHSINILMFITICKENVEKTGASYLACGVEDGEGEGDALRGRLGTGGRHTDEKLCVNQLYKYLNK